MGALLTHMGLDGLWLALGTIALLLSVLLLVRALFPDFGAEDTDRSGREPRTARGKGTERTYASAPSRRDPARAPPQNTAAGARDQ